MSPSLRPRAARCSRPPPWTQIAEDSRPRSTQATPPAARDPRTARPRPALGRAPRAARAPARLPRPPAPPPRACAPRARSRGRPAFRDEPPHAHRNAHAPELPVFVRDRLADLGHLQRRGLHQGHPLDARAQLVSERRREGQPSAPPRRSATLFARVAMALTSRSRGRPGILTRRRTSPPCDTTSSSACADSPTGHAHGTAQCATTRCASSRAPLSHAPRAPSAPLPRSARDFPSTSRDARPAERPSRAGPPRRSPRARLARARALPPGRSARTGRRRRPESSS